MLVMKARLTALRIWSKITTAIGVGDLAFQFAQANTSDGSDANSGGKDTSFGVNLGLGDLTLRVQRQTNLSQMAVKKRCH